MKTQSKFQQSLPEGFTGEFYQTLKDYRDKWILKFMWKSKYLK